MCRFRETKSQLADRSHAFADSRNALFLKSKQSLITYRLCFNATAASAATAMAAVASMAEKEDIWWIV